jgi:hypothetical protein
MGAKGQGKLDEFAFVLLAGLVVIIVMLLVWGVPSPTQIPIVSPTSKTLSVARGSSDYFLLEINVTSELVTLEAKGTIKDWIEFSDNDFEAKGLTSVKVTVNVPQAADERDYHGSIVVETKEGGEATIPLTITVRSVEEKIGKEVSRTVYIGDFTISFTKGEEVIKTERDVEIKKSLSEDKKFSMSARIEQDMNLVTEGKITLDIFYTNYEGNLVVKFNNEVVYDDRVMPGELIIPVQKKLLKPYNVIEISSSRPWWKFWTASVYQFERVEFSIDMFGDIKKTEVFEVFRDEITNFVEGTVDFYVNSYDGPGDLTVSINDYKIYEGRRRGHFSLSFNFADVGLVKGLNTITFSTEEGTTYEIEKAKIIIVHTEMETALLS